MGLALAHQADVEFHRTADDFGADALIVAVDGAALLGGEVHGGEAVNMVADGAVMTAVAALYHQVGGNKRALPGARYGGGDLIPCGAVGLTDGTGVHALDAAQFDGVIADDPADVFHGAVHGIGGIEPHIADHGGAGRNNIGGFTALHLGKGYGGAHQGIQFAALLFAQVIQYAAEEPEVGEDHAVKEGGMTAEGIEHLGGRGSDVHGKGLIFYPSANTFGDGSLDNPFILSRIGRTIAFSEIII